MEYCEVCCREVETRIITRREVLKVLGEEIEVDARVMVCADCGEELFCEDLDSATLISAYNEYRKRHKLLFPEEIKQIRELYGLSQRSFAKLLGCGDKTIFRYENGSVQDKVHNSLLLFLRSPENMKTYLLENEVAFEEKQKAKLLDTIDRLLQNPDARNKANSFTQYFSPVPCEENGFKCFDYEKLCAMVLFFAKKNTGLLKTKLMKLLNYSDMIFYKENGISMSGLKYIHLPYGPVPDDIEKLLVKMESDHIAHVEVSFRNEYECHRIIPECEIPQGALTDKELRVLERIYEKFKNFGSVEISAYSHRETGYRYTNPGSVISYAYARDIQLN